MRPVFYCVNAVNHFSIATRNRQNKFSSLVALKWNFSSRRRDFFFDSWCNRIMKHHAYSSVNSQDRERNDDKCSSNYLKFISNEQSCTANNWNSYVNSEQHCSSAKSKYRLVYNVNGTCNFPQNNLLNAQRYKRDKHWILAVNVCSAWRTCQQIFVPPHRI